MVFDHEPIFKMSNNESLRLALYFRFTLVNTRGETTMTEVKFGREIAENNFSAVDLSKKAIIYDNNDIGKLSICTNETLRHYIAKSMLVYHLKRLKHRVVTEARIEGIGFLDVYDIDTNVIYEIETEKSIANSRKAKEKYQQTGVDIVIIQIKDWTDSIGWLSDYIKMWIRPD